MPRVSIDFENNADAWWDALAANHRLSILSRTLDGALISGKPVRISARQLRTLERLPGWDSPDAPDYAPHPLVVHEHR